MERFLCMSMSVLYVEINKKEIKLSCGSFANKQTELNKPDTDCRAEFR